MARSASMRQRLGGLGSKARKMMAVCMGGVLLLSTGNTAAEYLREGLQQRILEEVHTADENPHLAIDGRTAKCEFKNSSASGGSTGSLTLSQNDLTAALECVGESVASIPTELTNKVCQPKQGDARESECTFSGTDPEGTAVALKDILGVTADVQWTEEQSSAKEVGTRKWTLELKEDDLPLTPKSFLVGCLRQKSNRSAGDAKACKLTVNVEARASSVGGDNVVTCAYGKDSNHQPLKVDMSPEKNTLTIKCGSEGSLIPTSYATEYCDPHGEEGKCTQKNFKDIFPMFAESWWKKEDEKGTATLTIPETGFPESEHQFRIGCALKESSGSSSVEKDGGQTQGSQVDVKTSSCNVVVTVKLGSSASSSGRVVGTLVGAAAMVGLLGASV
ncbi:SAG-related sequence SRS40D [Toxoplasma gondii FOU]|uniref:SAG-related sequence SRS40D n=3 Tax=Toxoplasma gondii TaxID=5811 RepID=A0A086LEF9_TOXGO|nr:SAG-related sequence SRS40D [Toxoplasma gondii FOU]PUA91315.1 SAG-related sequence SRS40D [Toxoplasma gondii TgCATBr9]RQX74670.1 SAG-related sequence SRS40D [Toxoplasma gondii CAST]